MKDLDIATRTAALVADFGRGYSRPEQKFLQDLVFGILHSRSCLLSEISRAIGEGKNVRTVLKRLDFNLGRYDLSRAYERAQTRMLRGIDENYLFIFDPSEIVKPFAKMMEGLCRVRDASEKPRYVYTKVGKKAEIPNLKPGWRSIKKVGKSAARIFNTRLLHLEKIGNLQLNSRDHSASFEQLDGRFVGINARDEVDEA